MTTIELVGIHAGRYSNFLAVLGLLRVCRDRWPDITASTAESGSWYEIANGPESFNDLVDHIAGLVDEIGDGILLGCPPDWPTGPLHDLHTLKIPLHAYGAYARRLRETSPTAAEQWLPSLITPAAINANGQCRRSPLFALSGRQTIGSGLAAPVRALQKYGVADTIVSDLSGGARREMAGGIYLDDCDLQNAAHHPDGKAREYDRPALAWLATQAIPLLRLDRDGLAPTTHRVSGYPVLHLWPHFIPGTFRSLDEIMQIVVDPRLRPVATEPAPSKNSSTPIYHQHAGVTVDAVAIEQWGIHAIHVAHRQELDGRKFAGPLRPIGIAGTHTTSTPHQVDLPVIRKILKRPEAHSETILVALQRFTAAVAAATETVTDVEEQLDTIRDDIINAIDKRLTHGDLDPLHEVDLTYLRSHIQQPKQSLSPDSIPDPATIY